MDNSLSRINPNITGAGEARTNKPSLTESGQIFIPKDEFIFSDKNLADSPDKISPDSGKIQAKIFPQDAMMSAPEVVEIDRSKISPNLESPRFYIKDEENPIAIADPEGKLFYEPTQPQFDQVNSLIVATKSLDMLESYFGRKVDWPDGIEKLCIHPHAGEGTDAQYSRSRGKIDFYFYDSKEFDKRIQTSQSADMIAHEVSHAVLDSLRPEFKDDPDNQTNAFHEAFGDCGAMLYALTSESNIKEILKETGGDLSKENRLAKLGEEHGTARRLRNDDPNDNKPYVRTALNDFKYKHPADLPSQDYWENRENELTTEPHNYSRVFSGAFYDCIDAIYQKNLSEGKSPEDSLKDAGSTMGKILAKSADIVPDGHFPEMTLCMIKADQMLNGGKNMKELEKVFLEREFTSQKEIDDFKNSGMKMRGMRE